MSSYLYKNDKTQSPDCVLCNEVVDDTDHGFFRVEGEMGFAINFMQTQGALFRQDCQEDTKRC